MMDKKNIKKRILSLAATFLLLFQTGCTNTKTSYLTRDDWADDVKEAVNSFIDIYGNKSDNYNENSYVVSDFDNTASIFDTCEQLSIYQAEVMGYGFTPAELPNILSSGLGDMNEDLSDFGYGNGTYNDWISDITNAYTYLYNTYGPFSAKGLDEESAKIVQSDIVWSEFTAKIMNLYFLISDNESSDVSYPWITYLYSGLSEDEVYDLAVKAFEKYGQVDTSEKTISTSSLIDSKVGVTKYTYIEGIQVTENTKELWKVLDENGIDVWVCSASECDIIRAAIDVFGLHDYCTGLIGMTPTENDGKLSYTYDYETGYAWYPIENGEWVRGDVPSHAQTQGVGKTIAVQNVCVSKYGCGPLAGFMDSKGDYNFCTEFESLKLVICFNRADRKVTDGGGLISEVAIYEKETLGYNLKKANAAGDTLYVLQGRDENGIRTLHNSNSTIRFGSTEERLFRNEENEKQLSYFIENKMSVKDIINTFAIKTAVDDPDNKLGFKYGFLNEYSGYHSIK